MSKINRPKKVCTSEKDAKKWIDSYPHKRQAPAYYGDDAIRIIVGAHYKEFELDKDYDFNAEWP